MVGANYMGGKRNTTRAKSKDVVGRAQRRHFGRQRLASALCIAQENRIHSSAPTLSSVLPDIALAHARYGASTDSGATSSIKVFSRDRLYSTTLPNNTTQRNKPSKVLGALDIFDHMSMRAAIDRILQQPNLVGINTPKLKETAYIECMQTPVAVRRPTEAYLDSEDPDIQHSETVLKHVFDPALSCPQILEDEHIGLPETNPSPRYEPTESSVLLSPGSPRMCDVKSWDAFDNSANAIRLFPGANPFFGAEGDEFGKPNTFPDVVDPVSWSSPLPSSSQTSDNLLLDLDTSPLADIRFGQSDHLSEEDDDCVDASSLHSICQQSRIFSIREGSVPVDDVQSTTSSFTSSDEEELKLERSRITRCDDYRTFSSTGNNDFRYALLSEYGRDSIQVLTSQEVTEDNVPSGISIDFLSDPHPWETIGRILKLQPPEPSAVQSVKISFTKDREGVGYVSPETSGICNACSSDATSLEMRIDDEPPDDIHVASRADPPMLEIAELEVLNSDGPMAVDTPNSSCANNATRALFDAGPPSTATRGDVGHYSHVRTLQEVHSIPVIHCTQNEHTRSSSPLAIIVGPAVADPDVDITFDGPCLFGDSDLEEDE